MKTLTKTKYHAIPDQVVEKIIKLYKAATPINRIASITGVSRLTIRKHLKREGIYQNNTGPINIYNIENIKKKDINKEDIKEDIKGNHKDKTVIPLNSSNLHIQVLDRLIATLLTRLNNKPFLYTMNPLQMARVLEVAVNKQVQLRQVDTPQASGDRFIINFINTRNFKKDLKEIQAGNDKPIDVKAAEETPPPPGD